MAVLLTRRAVVQADIESTYNTPVTLGTDDGVLVSEPMYTVEPNVLERDFVRDSLSTTPIIIGRKLSRMTFRTELRGNGRQQSGLLADAPIIARLFRACGYEAISHANEWTLGPFDVDDHVNRVTWAVDAAAATNTTAVCYFVTVSTGGASGTAQITITSDTVGQGVAAATITSGTPVELGTLGVEITPTFTGDLVLGQQWVIWVMPPGIELKPRSDDFESLTLAMYKDGVRHLMPGSFGTFEIEAVAGNYASISWTFTGTYVAPVDEAMPTPNYERTLPAQVELARLRIAAFNAIVETVSFNQNNDIQIRPDVSSSEGYIGTRIVARNPEGGINPEADLVASHDFWGKMSAAARMPFQMRVGTVAGNTVWMIAPGVQYTGLTYTDRQGILAYDAGLRFPCYNADDEVFFALC